MRERPAVGNGSSGSDAETETEVPLSDPQEFVDLPRREGKPLSRSAIAREMADLRRLQDDKELADAVFAHRAGSCMKVLYSGLAERVHQFPSYTSFAVKKLGVTPADASDLPRIAHHFSEKQCKRFGISRLRKYLVFFGHTGLTSWEALRERTFPVADGTLISLDSDPLPTIAELESALALLRGKKESPRSTRAARQKADHLNEAFRLAKLESPVLQRTRLAFVPKGSKVLMKGGPFDDEQRVELARFILKFERR